MVEFRLSERDKNKLAYALILSQIGQEANVKPKLVIVYSNIFYTFAFVNDIKKWNKAVRSFVVKTVSNV